MLHKLMPMQPVCYIGIICYKLFNYAFFDNEVCVDCGFAGGDNCIGTFCALIKCKTLNITHFYSVAF